MPTIATATADDLDDLLPLFAGYQTFYTGSAQDDAKNESYLRRLIETDMGRILIARGDDSGEALGFANLFWIHSSTTADDVVLLGDLFVTEQARGQNVGFSLIETSREVARERGSKSLSWQTAVDNRVAQRLYERTGADRTIWFEYELEV